MYGSNGTSTSNGGSAIDNGQGGVNINTNPFLHRVLVGDKKL